MADEENKQTEEETVDEAAPEQAEPEAGENPEEPKAEETTPEEPKAEEAPEAEEAPKAEAEDTPEVEEKAPAGAAPKAAAGSGDDELSWKAKKRLERSRRPHEAGPQRSVEERAAERAERRKASAAERRRYRLGKRAKREKGTGTEPAERVAVARKIRRGTVVSNKADKTITVRIDVARRHPTYEKIVRRSSTLSAHDERNEASEGDLVQIVETRPISKSKRWRLTEIVEKAK